MHKGWVYLFFYLLPSCRSLSFTLSVYEAFFSIFSRTWDCRVTFPLSYAYPQFSFLSYFSHFLLLFPTFATFFLMNFYFYLRSFFRWLKISFYFLASVNQVSISWKLDRAIFPLLPCWPFSSDKWARLFSFKNDNRPCHENFYHTFFLTNNSISVLEWTLLALP